MRIRTIVMLCVAIAAAAAAAGFARSWLSSQRALLDAELAARQEPLPKVEAIEILVTREMLPTGTFLKPEQFVWLPFPANGVTDAYFSRAAFEPEQLDGAVLRAGLTAGDPLTRGRIVRPGERGFLAAVLKPGMRAVSVPINATTGISGFVFPGDSVDLLLTHVIKDDRGNRRATETLLHDLRVLAVDQRTDHQEGTPALAKTATLEVDPEQAEVIAVAMEMGRLSLALRALARAPDAPATASPMLAGSIPFTASPKRDIALAASDGRVGGAGSAVIEETRSDRDVAVGQDLRTYTLDSEASQLIRRASAAPPSTVRKVHVVRAGSVQTISFSAGRATVVEKAPTPSSPSGGAAQ